LGIYRVARYLLHVTRLVRVCGFALSFLRRISTNVEIMLVCSDPRADPERTRP